MSDWNKPVVAPPRCGMSVLPNEQFWKEAIAGTQLTKKVANTLCNSIHAAFQSLGDALIKEVVLTLRTSSGERLLINPFDQASIDAAKVAAPGEGVEPAVSSHLVGLMSRGLITDASVLPVEYRHLGVLIGTSRPLTEAMLANGDTTFQYDRSSYHA